MASASPQERVLSGIDAATKTVSAARSSQIDAVRLTLGAADGVADRAPESEVDVLALDEALTRLAELDPRQAQVVELRYFTGSTIQETAHVLGLSHATVEREWRTARLWLRRELAAG
jgi:RNA polymerase sigma-70 factor, ECF subfamily